ncbi:MAG TPA: hypothetical protein VE360_15450 [Pyrinomonadaceae bacterium]|jgi:hypothetical protein|nr:hypothetical protein [Pyrinomonadaceae bacterium]
MRERDFQLYRQRPRERGAALVMSLLISMLLLAAGGALLMATGMSAANAADSTAEAQAYYAAEAGLQAALSVVRGNRPSSPAGTPATYRNLVCGTSDPCANNGTLNLWLPRNGNGVVPLSASPPLAYALSVQDAGLAEGAPVPPEREPRFLIITSRGFGPKGATKVLRMMVDAFPFDFTARAAVAIRSHDTDSTPMQLLDVGESNPHLWNGNDSAIPPAPPLPAFAVTNTADFDAGDGFDKDSDQGSTEKAIGGDEANVLGDEEIVVKLDPTGLEWWLQKASSARAFVDGMKERATTLGRLNPGDIGTEASPKFTFIEGDLAINGGDHGAGLLIVTGKITQGGGSSFKGIILALGEGYIDRDGTPSLLGALIVAKFDRSPGATGNFLAPYVESSGGGNSLVGYNSDWVRKALASGGSRVVGIVEQ